MDQISKLRKKVVIVGAGFGGLSAAKGLGNSHLDVVVIDRANHHLFQPLLYQVATAMLSPAAIAVPIRHVLKRFSNIRVKMLEVTGVNTAQGVVLCGAHLEPYDYLIIASGAECTYFGHPWEKFAPSLKTLEDARRMRQLVLTAFEKAEIESDPNKRLELLTCVIIGGGPTGVELSGAIAELSHQTIAHDFKVAEVAEARIVLIEAGPRILGTFSEKSSMNAEKALKKLGVEIRVARRVIEIKSNEVILENESIHAGTILWAAGVRSTRVAEWLSIAPDKVGRVCVEKNLTVPGHSNIFVIGDAACVLQNNVPLPGVAPVAMQEGRFIANTIRYNLKKDFIYKDKGSLATIGRRAAVAEFGGLRLHGLTAWITWTVVHIYYLIGFRNRVVVLMEWAWAYLTRTRGARLISVE